jgi:hypothetical protein
VAGDDRQHQRGLAMAIPGIDVGTGPEQVADRLDVPAPDGAPHAACTRSARSCSAGGRADPEPLVHREARRRLP